ncbi:MAG: hypothetical protein HY906_17215 [Deltaproteobacteria bacterium]|nr:hypothetical protein [Deltaproteobacteria bacterium]
MSPLDARVAVLVAELQREWGQIAVHLAKAGSVDPASGDAAAALVALSLDHAYQAFETWLVRLERALGLPERGGAGWHLQLLLAAGQPVPGLRPAAYPMEAASDWDDLRRFRHFLRRAYAVALDPEKLRANVARLERAVAATDPHVAAVVAALSGE